MQLRVQLSIDVEAADFIEAADHQRRLEELFRPITEAYPPAVLQIRERRPSTTTASRPPSLPEDLLRLRRSASLEE